MTSWNIAIGNFFFRYRNALFPLIFAAGALTLRPQILFGSWLVDRLLVFTVWSFRCSAKLAGSSPSVLITSIAAAKMNRSMPDAWFVVACTQ